MSGTAVHAKLQFASNADRGQARADIAAFAGQRSRTRPDIDEDRPRRVFDTPGPADLIMGIWMTGHDDADMLYETIAAMVTPLPGSRVYEHTCQHGVGGLCVISREKIW
jgi:hypothetical protein